MQRKTKRKNWILDENPLDEHRGGVDLRYSALLRSTIYSLDWNELAAYYLEKFKEEDIE